VKATSYIADFDSAAAMLRQLSHYLHGRSAPLLGPATRWAALPVEVIATAVNRLPDWLKEQVYIWSGRYEAISPRKLTEVKTEGLAQWVAGLYPERSYQAIALGSSNGALTHLWAALGIPWLPQTFLIPVARHGPHPDEPLQDLQWAQEPAAVFLNANPDVQLHHMHDPNQDRLMIRRMTYFRFKWLRLADAYARFVERRLEPGGTIFIVDCRLRWPATRLGDRHLFQFGALGGASPDEYHHGGPRVADYLARYNSHRTQWQAPAPDGEYPEAEWGFELRLLESVEELARRRGYRIRRVEFDAPEDTSPLAADFYEHWNRRRSVMGKRLLVESFIVMEPYWTIRTGSVPFWMVFNKMPSANALKAYLEARDPFDEIYMMLFSHGVESIGLTPINAWRRILERASKGGVFVGVDESAFPRDFAVFVRYHFDLQRKIQARYPIPAPLTLSDLEGFLDKKNGHYNVNWVTA